MGSNVAAEQLRKEQRELRGAEKVEATSVILLAASFFIGAECKSANDGYMLCKRDKQDPGLCLEEGRNVVSCVNQVLKKLEEHCPKELLAYSTCLDMNNQQFMYCRDEEREFNKAVYEKLVCYID